MSKQDEKKLYEQQEEKILAQSDAFISLLTKRGILADQKIDSEKVRSAKQENAPATVPYYRLDDGMFPGNHCGGAGTTV